MQDHDPARLPHDRAGVLVPIPRPAGPRGELPDGVAIIDPPAERDLARAAFLEALRVSRVPTRHVG